MENQEKVKRSAAKLGRVLRLARNITAIEENYIETWINEFNYDMSIIEEALKKTAGKTYPNFKYIHSVLSAWHSEGIRTIDQLKAYLEAAAGNNTKQGKDSTKYPAGTISSSGNDDDFFEKLNETTIIRKESN